MWARVLKTQKSHLFVQSMKTFQLFCDLYLHSIFRFNWKAFGLTKKCSFPRRHSSPIAKSWLRRRTCVFTTMTLCYPKSLMKLLCLYSEESSSVNWKTFPLFFISFSFDWLLFIGFFSSSLVLKNYFLFTNTRIITRRYNESFLFAKVEQFCFLRFSI